MDVIDAIKNRRSIRAFLKKPVPKKIIYDILDAARFAPSGVNHQPWKVFVVDGKIKDDIGAAIINAREANIPENPDYHYYPTEWVEPYKTRRKECGMALYGALGIKKEDTEKRKEAWYRNYHFFDAPIGLLFFVDRRLAKGSWVDMGMFIQNVMLAARHFGLETCPQASLAEYPDIVRGFLEVSEDFFLICGMSLGYADYDKPVNQYRLGREPVDSFVHFKSFSAT